MYSWYMPKDSPSSGLGHRHDWENIVVWLSAQSTSATVTGVAISAHGEYQKESSPSFQGTSPKIGYISYFPVNHQLIATNDLGGQQPLIAWESMTAAARTAIENTVSAPRIFLRLSFNACTELWLCDTQLQEQQLSELSCGGLLLSQQRGRLHRYQGTFLTHHMSRYETMNNEYYSSTFYCTFNCNLRKVFVLESPFFHPTLCSMASSRLLSYHRSS